VKLKEKEKKLNEKQRTQDKITEQIKKTQEEIRDQLNEDPHKPLDYKLLYKLQELAAKRIQIEYKFKQNNKDLPSHHGNLVDRHTQTDKLAALTLHVILKFNIQDNLSADKFKKFFFAVFYTYMMMNTVMADALPKQK